MISGPEKTRFPKSMFLYLTGDLLGNGSVLGVLRGTNRDSNEPVLGILGVLGRLGVRGVSGVSGRNNGGASAHREVGVVGRRLEEEPPGLDTASLSARNFT